MSMKIHLTASEVWGYFLKNKEELKTDTFLIAENPEFGTEIYLTYQCGYPCISVMADDFEVHSDVFIDSDDCKQSVDEAYDLYLTERIVSTVQYGDDGEEIPTTSDEDNEIIDREAELDGAVLDFLTVAIDGKPADGTDLVGICEDLKDHFLEYIARKYELKIRRPMYLEYEDGSIEYTEYPYENMEFEDEGNPIYR